MICSTLLLAALVAEGHFAQDAGTLRRAALYEPLMVEAGERHGVDPRLLWTIAFLETRFRPGQVSRAGAKGMMQFMPATAARFGLGDPHDAARSIDAAARYLHLLRESFGDRLDLLLAAYNAGEGAVAAFRDGRRLLLSNGKVINPNGLKTGGVPPYRETRGYVDEGIALYRRLAERRELSRAMPAVKYRRLGVPEGKRSGKPPDKVPDEIAQLKRGSIYIVDSARVDNTTTMSATPTFQQNAPTPRPSKDPRARSLYVR